MRIATASVRTGFAMTHCKKCGTESAGGQGRPPLRRGWNACVGRATARVAPTEALQEVRDRNPPVTASPCQPPLGKGAVGTGVRIATASVRTGFAMTGFCKECGTESAGGQRRPPLRRGWNACVGRATARVAPTEGYKRCGGVKNPPVTASPCQPALGKGPRGRGRRIATASVRTGFAMTWFLQGARGK